MVGTMVRGAGIARVSRVTGIVIAMAAAAIVRVLGWWIVGHRRILGRWIFGRVLVRRLGIFFLGIAIVLVVAVALAIA
jgi:hypothetical protein